MLLPLFISVCGGEVKRSQTVSKNPFNSKYKKKIQTRKVQSSQMSLLTIIQFSTSAMLSLSMLIVCKQKKPKKIYKPGHIPEFENPENEESDTYYGLNSSRLFPDREKGRVNRSALEEENAKAKEKADGSMPVSHTPKSHTTKSDPGGTDPNQLKKKI